MHLTHKIRLDPTAAQRNYFLRAAGTSRFVYNWGLAKWNELYEKGDKPTANSLKKLFNSIYKTDFSWVGEVHRDCHSQPFADLQVAFTKFFKKLAERPVFKKKGKSRAAFYVANDKLKLDGYLAVLPVIGRVRMREQLRFVGKIMSARVVEDAGNWSICVSVDIGEFHKPRQADDVVGVDLGVKTLATLSTGEQIPNPKPLTKASKKLKRAQRKFSRPMKGSKRRNKQRKVVARIHRRIRNIRHDNLHKLTTRLCRENQAVVIEDLNVSGMVKNHCLARAISDTGFRIFRTLLAYKAIIYRTTITVVNRFYPSSKACSRCGQIKLDLSLKDRVYNCDCGLSINRDLNAALNLRSLAGASGEVTLGDSDSTGGTEN